MKRVLLHTCLGLACGFAATTVRADDWRPVESKSSTTNRVQLGKPIGSRAAAPAENIQQASSARNSDVQPTGVIMRGQSPDGTPVRPVTGFGHGHSHGPSGGYSAQPPSMVIPGSPEEQYNCGVVSEGPATGGPIFGAPSSWMGGISGLFGTSTNFLSDHAFDNFISPVSNPFFFEDPRSLTELRPIFIYQHAKSGDPLVGDADIFLFALQARLALTDRWSLTLNKLGFMSIDSNGLVGSESGMTELNFGLKYTFWRDDVTNTIMALGLQVELPIGDSKIAQNIGDASLTPYFSFAKEFAQNWHFMGSFGYRFSLDNQRSESFFLSGHLDYSIFNRIFPLVEVNWYHVTKNGSATPSSFEGQDLFNLGATNAKGTDVVTIAAGVRFKITEAAQLGVVFEMPLTNRDELMRYRISADFILRY